MAVEQAASSPTVSFQDPGTGVSDHFDPNSAAMIAGAFAPLASSVVTGLSLDADSTNGEVTVGAGVALVEHDGTIQVQSEQAGSYDRVWQGPAVLPVSVDATTVGEDTSGVNHVYLDVDFTADNTASVITSSTENPTELGNASLYLGTADTGAGTVDESAGDRAISGLDLSSVAIDGGNVNDVTLARPSFAGGYARFVDNDDELATALTDNVENIFLGTNAGASGASTHVVDYGANIQGSNWQSVRYDYLTFDIQAQGAVLKNFGFDIAAGPHIQVNAGNTVLENISGGHVQINSGPVVVRNPTGCTFEIDGVTDVIVTDCTDVSSNTFSLSNSGDYTIGVVPKGSSADSDLQYS